MKRRSFPLWLLRDVPALLGVLISFWPLMILVITNGFRAMAGKKVRKSAFDDFPILLAHAEARLDFALWREAYRRVGWDHRAVQFEPAQSSDDWAETGRRFQSYQRAFGNLEACARAYVHALCERHGINERDASNGIRPLRLATTSRATSPGFADGGKQAQSLASLAVRRGRWIAASARRDGGGSHSCRGPPHIHVPKFRPTPPQRFGA